MTQPTNSAEYITAFATGWPEDKPDLMIISLTTGNGKKDYVVSRSQALLMAKTLKKTAAQLRGAV